MDRSAVIEALRQVWEGMDIPPAESLLRNVSVDTAAKKLPWMPYSILTNVAHADFWQRVWLNRLKGLRVQSFTEDWKTPPAEEWPQVRSAFLEHFQEAIAIAKADAFEHKMKSDEVAVRTLLQIAIHNAYHVGQVNLLKRELRLHGKLPDEDKS
jgi:hypothetical protein